MSAENQRAAVEMLIARGLRESRWLRARPGDSRWLIEAGVEYLSSAVQDGHQIERMRLYLDDLIRSRYGNPILTWFLLNVVLPIVVKLLVEWWFRHKEARDGRGI